MDALIPPRVPLSNLPSDTLKWMKKNAAPKMAVKLMKCHKYFQHPQFPWAVVTEIGYYEGWYFRTVDGLEHTYHDLEDINIIKKKHWITKYLWLTYFTDLASKFITKIAVCDVICLELENQKLSLKDFKFLTASGIVEDLILVTTSIVSENGDEVFLNTIFKCTPNLQTFKYFNNDLPNIFPEIVTSSKLKKIYYAPFSYDCFKIISKFMDLNPQIYYEIFFIDNSLSVHKTKIIKNYVQKIIDTGLTQYPPPRILYPGQTRKQENDLVELFNQYDTQKEKL